MVVVVKEVLNKVDMIKARKMVSARSTIAILNIL